MPRHKQQPIGYQLRNAATQARLRHPKKVHPTVQRVMPDTQLAWWVAVSAPEDREQFMARSKVREVEREQLAHPMYLSPTSSESD